MIDRLAVVEDWSRRTLGDEFARFLGPAGGEMDSPSGSQQEDNVVPASASR
jgi:membrane protein required for colicin V production